MPTEWYLMSNKHMSGFEKEEIERQYGVFDELLQQSPESYPIKVNTVDRNAIIQSTSDANKRVVLSRENDVNLGDLIDHKTNKWLVTELPVNNRVYDKSEMVLCNNTLYIEGEPTKTQIGTDDLGRPVYDYTDQILVDTPCVIQSDKDKYSNDQEQINIPEGQIVLHIQYTNKIKPDQEFKMLNDDYKVVGIDMSKTLNNDGVLIVQAAKIQ